MMFMIVSFLFHPIRFVKGWNVSRKHFDREGYPFPGHETNECDCFGRK